MRRLARRLRADGVFSLQVLKTAVATALAYQLGRLTGSQFPIFAALAALLVVQVTVIDTISRSLQRISGVVVGVLVAYGIAQTLGVHAWSVGVVVLLGIALGRALRLGEGGAVQVPVSALLVLTLGARGSYAVDRVVETILGAAVGLAVNLILIPQTKTHDAGVLVRRLALGEASVLHQAGRGLQDDDWGGSAQEWLDDARRQEGLLRQARDAVGKGEQSLRLNPRGPRLVPVIARRRLALQALEHVNVQVRGIARTLVGDVESAASGAPRPARQALGQALEASGAAVGAFGELAADPAADQDSDLARALSLALGRAESAVEQAVAAARRVPGWQDGAWLVHGALLTDLDRLLGEIGGRSQADLLDARLRSRRGRGRDRVVRASVLPRVVAVTATASQRLNDLSRWRTRRPD